MKRMFFVLIAVMLVACMLTGIHAAATEGQANTPDDSSHHFDVAGSAKFDVTASYQPKHTVKTDISWETMTFLFRNDKWSSQKYEISVTNNSADTGLITELKFTPADGFEGAFFKKDENAPYYTQILSDSVVILGKKSGSDAPQQKYYFAMTGGTLTQEGQAMGNITLRIKPDDANVTISNASQLVDALKYSNIKKITFSNDINMASLVYSEISKMPADIDAKNLALKINHDVTIDLNGHKLYICYVPNKSGRPSQLLFTSGSLKDGSKTWFMDIKDGVTCNIINGTLDLDKSQGRFGMHLNSNSKLNLLSVTTDELWFQSYGGHITATDSTFSVGGLESTTNMFESSLDTSTLKFSGKTSIEGTFTEDTITCYAGEYSFNPTTYVDSNRFNITENTGTEETPTTWTVTEK